MKKLNKFEQIFVNITKNYVLGFPKHSFQYYFDEYQYPVIGKSKKIITVRFKNSKELFTRMFREGSMGLGECYSEGLIEVADQDYKNFLLVIVQTVEDKKTLNKLSLLDKIEIVKAKSIGKLFTNKNQHQDINSHYSLSEWFDNDNASNQFYLYWLDSPYIQYTCAKWDKKTINLQEAQINKFEFYAKRLGINKSSRGKTLLDLGCGWGGLMFYLAKKYGLICKGLTLSTAQVKYINKEIKKRKLIGLVSVEGINAHDMSGKFDYIISVGLLEHIDDYNDLYKKTAWCLKKDGKALFHAMFHQGKSNGLDPFLSKYIFPGGIIKDIGDNVKTLKKYFKYVNRNDLPSMSYPKTLDCWYNQFCRNEKKIRKLLEEKSSCSDIDFAIRIFKHYLILANCGLTVNGLVCNILVKN